MGFCDPQVKTCGYPRLAPSGPDRKLRSLAPVVVRGVFGANLMNGFLKTLDVKGFASSPDFSRMRDDFGRLLEGRGCTSSGKTLQCCHPERSEGSRSEYFQGNARFFLRKAQDRRYSAETRRVSP